MDSKFSQAIVGGFIATVVMTIIVILAAMFGLPEMKPPMMLSGMLNTSVLVGWGLHFVIGIIFAMLYAFAFLPIFRAISSNVLKGAIFGIIAFIIGQISMYLMGKIMELPDMDGSTLVRTIEGLAGHIFFGIVISLFVKENENLNKI